jgi:hypothetical protein
MTERYEEPHYGRNIALCLAWGMPWAALGLLLCATIVFSPVGLACLVAAGWPLARLQQNHMKRRTEWQRRDRPMPQEDFVMPPWLMEESEPDA